MKYDVFISYSRVDFEEVNAFVEMLKGRIPSLSVWFDITGIESGDEEFEEKIISAIDQSSYVIFALSDNSIKSQWAKNEVMYAKNTDKKVIPVLLRGAELKGWFLFMFGRVDCIDSAKSLQVDKLVKNLSDWTSKSVVAGTQSSDRQAKVLQAADYYELGEKAYDSKDYAEAVKWYRKAAEQGYVLAKERLKKLGKLLKNKS